MGMAQGESIEKIMNVLFKDVVPMSSKKSKKISLGLVIQQLRNIITVVREAISKK